MNDLLKDYSRQTKIDKAMDVWGTLETLRKTGQGFNAYTWTPRGIRQVSDEAYLLACQFMNQEPELDDFNDNVFMQWVRLSTVQWAIRSLQWRAAPVDNP